MITDNDQLDIETLLSIVEIKCEKFDGNLTIMKSKDGWKCILGNNETDVYRLLEDALMELIL